MPMTIRVYIEDKEFLQDIIDVYISGTEIDLLDADEPLDKEVDVQANGNYEVLIQYVPYELAGNYKQEDIQGVVISCKEYTWTYKHQTHMLRLHDIVGCESEVYGE